MAATRLSPETIADLGRSLPSWTVAEDHLERRWQFETFVQAWGFMTQVALLAESMNHHPNWSNVYGQVTIRLTTHDLSGLSTLDIALAEAIDRLEPRQST